MNVVVQCPPRVLLRALIVARRGCCHCVADEALGRLRNAVPAWAGGHTMAVLQQTLLLLAKLLRSGLGRASHVVT